MPFLVTVMSQNEQMITVFVVVEGLLLRTRECLYYEVQPTEEVTQGSRVDLSSVVKMAKLVLTYAEYSA